jgi:hypothetical protein
MNYSVRTLTVADESIDWRSAAYGTHLKKHRLPCRSVISAPNRA